MRVRVHEDEHFQVHGNERIREKRLCVYMNVQRVYSPHLSLDARRYLLTVPGLKVNEKNYAVQVLELIIFIPIICADFSLVITCAHFPLTGTQSMKVAI